VEVQPIATKTMNISDKIDKAYGKEMQAEIFIIYVLHQRRYSLLRLG
jgi:hypothetical protein